MSEGLTTRKIWINALILLAYLGLALGMTWPLLVGPNPDVLFSRQETASAGSGPVSGFLGAQIHTHLPGDSADTLVHYWNGWWVKQALTAGQSPFHTPYLRHPTGLSLVYHNFAWGSIIHWLMLEPLVGAFAAYNLSILANLALCGFTAFLLAYELTGDRRAAFLAGLIYQCWPFRLYQLDHPNLISTQWMPLFLLFLNRTIHQGKRREAVITGLFLALTGYTRWQMLLPAALLGGVLLLCTLPARRASWRRWAPALLLAGLAALLALTPPALMLLNQQRSAPADLLREGEEEQMQTDLLAYLTPSRSHSVLGPLTEPAYARYYPNRSEPRRFAAYIGLSVLITVVLGAWSARRSALPWAAMALLLVLLALGSTLRVNGQLYPKAPMPYRLAARLYVVRLLRFPDRFNMFLALPISILSAYGLAHALALVRRRGQWLAWVVSGLLGLVILFEYAAVPVPLMYPQISDFYHQLAQEPGDFAVLNLKLDAKVSKHYMFAQTVHQRPIVQGKTARFPPGSFDYLSAQPWLRQLRLSGEMPPDHDDVSRQLKTLAQDDVRYVILHKELISGRMSHWRHYFLIDARFEDKSIVVYPTSPAAGRDFTLAEELAPGIGPITAALSTECLSPGQFLTVDVGWGTLAPPEKDLDARLALAAEDGVTRIEQTFPLCAGWPTRQWPADAVARQRYRLDVPSSLPGGDYAVVISLLDSTGAAQGQSATVGELEVSEGECDFPIPSEAASLNALFGDEMRLLGYQVQRDGDDLTVTLHWRSERLIENDYKIFVHVFNPDSELRVTQDDSKPLRWTYPTPFWDAGEVVVDAIPLSLKEAPPGVYVVAVGVYDSGTGQRLPVMDRAGQLQPLSQMVLPGERIEVKRP